MSTPDTPEDAMPLLAYKIAPRQFDISYRLSNISLRDQIVRAQMLVRTLLAMGLVEADSHPENPDEERNVKHDFQLLICGAGAAGLAAAKEADACNISFVLVEKGTEIPGGVLSKNAHRYVSAAMYEWPHPNHIHHDYPLAEPELLGGSATIDSGLALAFRKPVLIKQFGDKIKAALSDDIENWKQNFSDFQDEKKPRKQSLLVTNAELSVESKQYLRKMLDDKVSIHGVPLRQTVLPGIELHHVAPASGSITDRPLRFQYIIYAVGFAKEVIKYAPTKNAHDSFKHAPFWEPDSIFDEYCGFAQRPHVGILGSGDGALQDALRCLIAPDLPHPLMIWDYLMDDGEKKRDRLRHSLHVHRAMSRIAAADGYTTGGAIWTHETHVFASLDKAFESIANDLILHERKKLRRAVKKIIRDDVRKVTIITQNGYFTKAYALNRFLIILLYRLLNRPDSPCPGRLEILSGEVESFEQKDSNRRGACMTLRQLSGETISMNCDLAIIRGGLDREERPYQQIGLTGADTGRVGLGRIPPPIRPITSPEAPATASKPASPAVLRRRSKSSKTASIV